MSAPRLFFAAMPPATVRLAIEAAARKHGVLDALGSRLFAAYNWHQSLSERIFDPTAAQVEQLRAVGAAVQAHAATVTYTRIDSAANLSGRIHVTLRAGSTAAFKPLLGAVQQALQQAGQGAIATGVTPHVTLSYAAPALLPTVRLPEPLRWTMDELLLVLGHGRGRDYRYDVLGRWPLLPERDPPPTQMGLF